MGNTTANEMMGLAEGFGTEEMDGKYLTFWTDGQLFGVPISDVMQIVQRQPIIPIPEFPHYAKGIINLRGSIIPVVDIRLRLGKNEAEYDDRTCIIIITSQASLVGFIVDSVDEVTPIPSDEISPPPKMSDEDTGGRYLSGVGRHEDSVVLLVDVQKLLRPDDFSSMPM